MIGTYHLSCFFSEMFHKLDYLQTTRIFFHSMIVIKDNNQFYPFQLGLRLGIAAHLMFRRSMIGQN